MAVKITQGTETNIKSTTDGVNGEIQHVRNDGGTIVEITSLGTAVGLGSISNIGTIKEVSNAGTNVNIVTGTVDSIGTVDEITNLVSGTLDEILNVGTLGSIVNIAAIHNAGTVSALPTLNLTTGTITTGSIGNVAMLHAGTIDEVTTVGALPDPLGSVVVTAGTVETTLGDLVGGTIDLVTRLGNIGTIESGTVTTSLALDTGTISTIAAGTQNTLGTVGTVIGIGTLTDLGSIGTIAGLGGVVQVEGTVSTGGAGTQPVSFTNDPLGSVVVTAGTVDTTLVLDSGTISQVQAGTLEDVTITALPDPLGSVVVTAGTFVAGDTAGGTLDLITGVGTLGSISNIAVVHNAGTVAALPTLNVTTGTLTTGSISNIEMLHAGTIDNIANLAKGTITTLGTLPGVGVLTSLTSQSAGTLNTLGTVGVVNNIVTGTLASVSLNPKYTGSQILISHAVGTTGGTVVGTLSAASGAGTYHYVSGLQIVVGAGTTDVFLGFGTTTTGGSVLARGIFTPSGGIMRNFTFPVRSVGTNSEICYIIAGAGTVSIAVDYWKGV